MGQVTAADAVLINDLVARVLDRLHGEGHVPAPTSETDLAPLIDHTLLSPEAIPDQIDCLCAEAVTHGFAAVCVQPRFAERSVRALAGTDVAVASVVGFPHGASLPEVKEAEARALLSLGVTELDMVIPIGLLRAGEWSTVAEDITRVVRAAKSTDDPALVKVIIEACLLTDAEKVAACAIAESCGADFVKTSTGYSSGGATVEDVRLMRQVVGDRLGIKAAGGIRTRAQALEMVAAGATRIGTSRGPALLSG